ncbi:Phenoloxidase-activating factor 2-like 1 [Homarus americanus]|uniref:Phenoloxidase-activating factor 2-like 1 n=1 Tax=Homarus americanus TaxID=6706 RepID=A0A8J5MW11_HOMAM|nr:Phenoloxidase-activating factor 2-like 1 [Homarus americanus]
MRLWACVCAVLVVSVESQRSNPNNPRLGLVSTLIGVDPVPGGPNFNTQRPNPGRQCVCLPVNQQCPIGQLPSIGTPIGGGGGNGGNFGAGVINVRIVNLPQAGVCPDQKMCCVNHGGGPVGPGTATPRPSPIRPNPVPIGDTRCGIQNPLPLPHQSPQFAQADFGEYPWVAVVLDLSNNYKGGGALIAPNWVLTAAHRVKGERQVIIHLINLKVRMGDLDVSTAQEHPTLRHLEVNVARVVIHPNFDDKTLRHDVALLQLTQSINTGQFPHIGTVCLPEQGQLFAGHSQCWVTGWGKDAFNSTGLFQNNLKEVDLPVVDPTVCQERLRQTRLGTDFILDSNSFVCAGGFEGKDACTGDGGAPLVCPNQSGQFTVVGLVAWGIGCATSEVPGVYVNIPNFVNFIYSTIRS